VPGLPIAPFGVLAVVLAAIAYALRRQPAPIVRDERAEGPIEIVVGAGASLDESALATSTELVRRELFEELGVRLPAIAPVRSDRLLGDAYEIRVAGVRVDAGRIPSGRVFVRASIDELRELIERRLDGGGWIEAGRRGSSTTAADDRWRIGGRRRASRVLFGIERPSASSIGSRGCAGAARYLIAWRSRLAASCARSSPSASACARCARSEALAGSVPAHDARRAVRERWRDSSRSIPSETALGVYASTRCSRTGIATVCARRRADGRS
jgi:hypothetical protein